MCCVALPCCLFDLACFFLPSSFLSICIYTCIHTLKTAPGCRAVVRMDNLLLFAFIVLENSIRLQHLGEPLPNDAINADVD